MTMLSPVPRLTKDGFAATSFQHWLNLLRNAVTASVAALKINTANGFAGSVLVSPDGTAAITLDTTVTGIVKGAAGALTAAIANTDYVASITLSGDATGIFSAGDLPVTLAASGVTAGVYGASTVVPQITVDTKGRLTLVTGIAIASVPISSGVTGSRPGSPANGTQYLDTTIGQPIWALSTAVTGWINAAGVAV